MSRARPRVVFLTETPQLPADTGARQRSNIIARALARTADLRLVVVSQGALPPADLAQCAQAFGPTDVISPAPAGRSAPWSLVRPFAPAAADRLARALDLRHPALAADPGLASSLSDNLRSKPADLLFCRYIYASFRARAGDHPPAVLDLDDVEPLMLREWINDPSTEAWRRPILRARLRHLEAHYTLRLRDFSALAVSSETDAAAIPGRTCAVLPNIPYAPENDPIPALPHADASREIMIVASWYYPPNFDGLQRFLDRCWPEIRRRVPDASLNIVGGSMREEHRRRWSVAPGVRVTGFAKDLRAEYARAAFAIAPVYYGGGTKIKVLESLAHQRACVVTEHAWRGYESKLPDAEALLVGRTDAAFADACARLLTDVALRRSIAERGRSFVQQHFSFDRVCRVVEEQVRAALSSAPPAR